MTALAQLAIYIRQLWPSSYEIGPLEEVVLNKQTVQELKEVVSIEVCFHNIVNWPGWNVQYFALVYSDSKVHRANMAPIWDRQDPGGPHVGPMNCAIWEGSGMVQNWQPVIILTLNMRGPSYLGLTRSISWLLMPWLLTSPGHQQPWYWLCRIGRFLYYLGKDFNYLCHINVEKWHKM